MASLVDHGLVKTAAAEQVVAPIAGHLCHLVLLCDGAAEPERFAQLEDAALAVANATANMAAVACRRVSETEDEVHQMEMSSLLESVSVSGQHVLLTAQKLSIQPALSQHKEELITAAQNVLLGVVKVLVVDDDATVRKILAAADQVMGCLDELASSLDIVSLLRSFKSFSEALLLLSRLTMDRAKSLQDPSQAQELFDSLETLRKCISMLHTAMHTTIKHPASEQAQASKRYILDKVESTVNGIVATLKSDGHRGSLGPCGYYTGRRDSLVRLLTSSFISSIRGSGFDSMVRDLVFHCMVVANSSRKELQQRVVGYCRHVLQFWSDITRLLKFPEDPERPKQNADDICSLLLQQIQMLDRLLMTTVLYQVLDTFTVASSTSEELASATRQILDAAESTAGFHPDCVQPLLEDFLCLTDRIIQIASFISAFAVDAKSLENVENSRTSLSRLRSVIAPLSLELDGSSLQTVQKLHDLLQRWEEDTAQLQDSLSDVMDVREFTSIAIHEMVSDRRGCDAAYKEQSYGQFSEHARDLVGHMKQVIQSVKRHLDKSDNPIYRNGLLVLLKQVQASQAKVAGSIGDMLCGSDLNVEAFSPFSGNVSTAIQHFKVLREGLDGQQHPHLLSPLRENVRQPVTSPSPPPAPVRETDDDTDLDQEDVSGFDSPGPEDQEMDFELAELEEEYSRRETAEEFLAHKYDDDDLKLPAATSDQPKLLDMPLDVDLLPLLDEVVTVTKGKDVTALNRACTSVLELSNCYVQAAKEASAIVDTIDCQTLDDFRAELVSLTPLLVQTAQETAMSSGMSTESVFKHSAIFSDLINNIRRVLLPVAGTWHHSVYALLQGNQPPNAAATVAEQLGEVVALCGDVVQLLMSSDVPTQKDCPESFTALQNKLSKAQNNTRHVIELVNSPDGHVDQLEAPCILWALSIQILLNSLDKVLGTSTAARQVSPQKRLSALSENSLRIQEAARLTGINCKSAYKVKQLTDFQEELKIVTETYLQAAEELTTSTPSVLLLAKSEFLQRKLLMKLRLLCGHLSKANKDYIPGIQSIVDIAYLAAENQPGDDDRAAAEDAERQFEDAARVLFENVRGATKRVEDCFSYVRDPRARSNLKSINDHLSFQISDVVSRARLVVETRCASCDDVLGLEVQTQCWSAKAHYLVQEVGKLDGIRPEARELIKSGLQGRAPAAAAADHHDKAVMLPTAIPASAKEVRREFSPDIAPWHKDDRLPTKPHAEVAEINVTARMPALPPVPALEKHARARPSVLKDASSLTYTSLFLKQESDSWDPEDNRIVQVTRTMADKIYYMTQYLRKKGPIANKEAFVNTARDVISDCQSVTQFVRVIANHCVDKQCTVELSLLVEQILTVTSQLSIISSVNAVTPAGCKSSNEILVKNAQNLLQTVLLGVRAAETACIKGLTQPEPDSDGAEAAALCFQWRRNLQMHRAQQHCSLETDDLGLRKTSSTPVAPSLAISPIHAQEGFK